MTSRQPALPSRSCRRAGLAGHGVILCLAGFGLVLASGITEPGLLPFAGLVLPAALCVFLGLKLRRVSAERRLLEESQERQAILTQATNEPVWDWFTKEERFWWNEAYARVLGLPPGAVPSLETWKRHIAPRDRDRVLLDLNRSLEGASLQWKSEYAYGRKDGSEGVLLARAQIVRDPKGVALRVVGSLMDVTERRRLEWERTRLAVAFSQSTELVAVLGTDGKITYVNPAFKMITGMDILEASGRCHDFMQRSGRNGVPFAEVASRVASSGSWSRRLECSRRGEGGDYVLQVTVTAIHGSSSHAEGYLMVGRDVTRELRGEAQERLAQKMEAVGLLAGGVSHDFNNLLQVINGYVQMLSEPELGDEERREAVKEIGSAAQRASQLTRQLQLFSRRQPMEQEHFDLAKLATDMLVLLRRQVGESVSIEFQSRSADCGVHADRNQIELVLVNLFLNARDAMPGGGRVTLSVGAVHLSESACEDLPWARPGDFVMLEVADDGCGMDRDTLARIYDPFFSTKVREKGAGLGLPIVYGIVRRHGGLLHVESEPGLGTRFQAYFPHAEAPGHVKSDTPAGADPVRMAAGSGLILVAEDDADVRKLVTRSLENAGFDVICAGDGEEAVRLFLENKVALRLAILDGAMPKLSGQEVHARIVKERPELPVIRCSGYSSGSAQGESMQTPLCQTIQKPYDSELLLQKIALMLAESGS